VNRMMLVPWLSMIMAMSLPAVSRRAVTGAGAALLFAQPVTADVVGEREVTTTIQVTPTPGKPAVKVTGVGDPSWKFPQRDITRAVYSQPWPSVYPFSGSDFTRMDEADDKEFYRFPKLVYHIDEGSVCALTRYYDAMIPDHSDVLDICSSWVSHYPRDFPSRMKSIVGVGISGVELACNDQLSSFKAQDLNQKPKLPFPDQSFDCVTCVVSFDYLTKPLDVMREVSRVLRPGGQLILSQSNRCFFTKAVAVWTRDMSDSAHLRVLGTYVHFADGLGEPEALDISPTGPGTNDPMYIVRARRRTA